MPINVQYDKGPFVGYTQLTTSAKAITRTGNDSSAGTTFTASTVTDSSPWALSGIEAGMVARTSGGWTGLITDVDDASDTITVQHWEKAGARDQRAAALPVAGETVTIHRVHMCRRLKIYAWSGNSAVAYIGRTASPGNTNSITISNTLTHPSSVITIEPLLGKMLDLTEWYGLASSGTFNMTYHAE